MSFDTTILALPSQFAYAKLSEDSGVADPEISTPAGVEVGVWVNGPDTLIDGIIEGEANGGNAVRCYASGSKYVLLLTSEGYWGFNSAESDGWTIGGFFRLDRIPTDTNWYALVGSRGSSGAGFCIDARHASNAVDLRLRVWDNGGNVATRIRRRATSANKWLCDGGWHHIAAVVKIAPGGASNDPASRVQLIINGLDTPHSANWGEASDGEIATLDRLSEIDGAVPIAVGAFWDQTAGGGSGAISEVGDVDAQRIFTCNTALDEDDIYTLLKAGTYTVCGMTFVDVDFDFTDTTLMTKNRDGTGAAPSSAGDPVGRILAKRGDCYLEAPTDATRPHWDGTSVCFPNFLGGQVSATRDPRGMQLKNLTDIRVRHCQWSALAVVSPSAVTIYNVSLPTVLALGASSLVPPNDLSTNGCMVFGTGADGVCLNLQNKSLYAYNAAAMGVPHCTPSWSMIAAVAGANGSGAEGDGANGTQSDDTSLLIDDRTSSLNWGGVSAKPKTTGGSFDAICNADGWVGCIAPSSGDINGQSAFAGKIKRLIFKSKWSSAVETAEWYTETTALYVDIPSTSKVKVRIVGDSISSMVFDECRGYQDRIGNRFKNHASVVNLAVGTHTIDDQYGRLSMDGRWIQDIPGGELADNTLWICFVGTNNMVNVTSHTDLATATSHYDLLIQEMRNQTDPNVPILFVIPPAFSPVDPDMTAQGLYDYIYGNWYDGVRKLIADLRTLPGGIYTNVDGTHPDANGHQQIADLLSPYIHQLFPQLAPTPHPPGSMASSGICPLGRLLTINTNPVWPGG